MLSGLYDCVLTATKPFVYALIISTTVVGNSSIPIYTLCCTQPLTTSSNAALNPVVNSNNNFLPT